MSKRREVDKIFSPDQYGKSEWVTREQLENTSLHWGNNGNSRHGIFFGDNRYVWEKFPNKGKIERIRTISFNISQNNLYRPIRKDIDKYYKSLSCVVCGSKSDLVTDHKNDLYNDMRVLDRKTQTLDDFQCLCNHCNLQKRQVSKITRETGKRYGATNIPMLSVFGIDFIVGDEDFDQTNTNAMVGTYWYDPIAFMKYIYYHKLD